MSILVVVDDPGDWPLEMHDLRDVIVIDARTYLTSTPNAVDYFPNPALARSIKVFNLCKSYRYQSSGYYVSLLAEARGHKPLPTVGVIEDLQSSHLVRHLTEDINDLIQRLLVPLETDNF